MVPTILAGCWGDGEGGTRTGPKSDGFTGVAQTLEGGLKRANHCQSFSPDKDKLKKKKKVD